jgi:hypothetical protein
MHVSPRGSRAPQMLAEHGALRPGLAVDVATDVLWTLSSLAVYDLLVVERSWTDDRYLAWLTTALDRELLGDAPA